MDFMGKKLEDIIVTLPFFSQNFMLYEVEEDEEHNPIVMYIEDDIEYVIEQGISRISWIRSKYQK